MKIHVLIFIFLLNLLTLSSTHRLQKVVQISDNSPSRSSSINRRILHQPLFPSSSSPPPVSVQPPPPPPDSSSVYNPDQPFFPEVPNGEGTQNRTVMSPVVPSTIGSEPIPANSQAAKPIKKIAIVVSVGIVTLGMLCALSFYVYRHRLKHPVEDQKLEGRNSISNSYGYVENESSPPPPSSFLYIGTVDHSNQRSLSVPAIEDNFSLDGSPYRKFNPVKKSDRYRPSPDLQPLPPLSRAPAAPPMTTSAGVFYSSEEEGSHELGFYTPHGSTASLDEGYSTPASRQSFRSNASHGSGSSKAYSKRTSSRTRLKSSSHDAIKHAIIPSIKTTPPTSDDVPPENKIKSSLPRRAKFGLPPPPPNLALLQSISNQTDNSPKVSAATTETTNPPPPPPPPPPQPVPTAPTVRSTWTNFIPRSSETASESQYIKKEAEPAKDLENGSSSSKRPNEDDMEGTKPKLRPLHWDKVRATSDRATVWDQL